MTVVGRMTGGEGPGAYEVRTADGTRAVLKFATGPHLDFERAARTCDVLRGRGYPAPATLRTGMLDDTRFAVIELLPGEPGAQPRAGARRTHHRARRAPARRWHLGATAVDRRHRHECDGGPRRLLRARGACAAYSPETRALLDRLRAVAESGRDADVPTDDVVHMDLGRTTRSSTATRITGVIDWEGSDDRRRGLRPRHVRLLHARRRAPRHVARRGTRPHRRPSAPAVRRAHDAPPDRLVDPLPRSRRRLRGRSASVPRCWRRSALGRVGP